MVGRDWFEGNSFPRKAAKPCGKASRLPWRERPSPDGGARRGAHLGVVRTLVWFIRCSQGSGRYAGWAIGGLDITESLEVERRLASSAQEMKKLTLAVEQSPIGIIVTDTAG